MNVYTFLQKNMYGQNYDKKRDKAEEKCNNCTIMAKNVDIYVTIIIICQIIFVRFGWIWCIYIERKQTPRIRGV